MKIFTGKNDELSSIAEKIINAEDAEVILNVPRFSKLGESAINFDLLKREADAAGKKLVVESVDENILSLAESVGIASYNPFFRSANNRKTFSDIIPPRMDTSRRFSAQTSPEKEPQLEIYAENEGAAAPSELPVRSVNFLRRFVLIAALAGLFAASIVLAVKVLPRAEVTIKVREMQWEYSGTVKADKSITAFDAEKAIIPGALFVETKNAQRSFRASGKRFVERKAKGVITIYNAFSSDPQPLVATTRFQTADGKIYRLDKAVTVPGAKIVDGKIAPSSISVSVTADKPGAEYNIGPVERFSIPGFKGSPKFDAFYGSSDKAMEGGFVGEQAYPTEADIAAGKEEVARILEDVLKVSMPQQMPEGYTFLDGAFASRIISQTVNPETDQNGNFSILGAAELASFGFRESDLIAMMRDRARKELYPDVVVKDYEVSYDDVSLSGDRTSLSFRVTLRAMFVRPIDKQALLQNLLGKSENDAQAVIYSLPGFESGSINFWPFWVRSVPSNSNKVKIIIE